MSVKSQVLSLGTTSAVLIASAVERPVTVYISAAPIGNLALGGSDVSSSNGYGASIINGISGDNVPPITLQPGDALYGISDSGSVTVVVLTLGT